MLQRPTFSLSRDQGLDPSFSMTTLLEHILVQPEFFQERVLEFTVVFKEWQIETALLSVCRIVSTQAQQNLPIKIIFMK